MPISPGEERRWSGGDGRAAGGAGGPDGRSGSDRRTRAGRAVRAGVVTAVLLLAPLAGLPAQSGATAGQDRRPTDGLPRAPTSAEAPPQADRQESDGRLTVQAIFGRDEYSAEDFDATWRRDGDAYVQVESDDDGNDELWQIAADDGERTRLVASSQLVPEDASEPLSIHDFSFSPDGERILIFTDAQRVWRRRTKGKYYVFDRESGELQPVSEKPGWQWFAKFGPHGERVAFVREGDLFLTDLSTGRERRLTSSGGGDVLNGRTDWVYEEELGLRDGFRWSPDGRRIAYWQFDRSPIPPFYLLDHTKLYPELKPVRYPKAGTENSRVRVGVLDLESGETTWLRTGGAEYLARMEWLDEGRVAIRQLNRHQNRLEIVLGDAVTGETRPVLAETDSAWVDLTGHLTWIDGGARFVWSSERDGYRHLYLFRRDGSLVRQLTDGDWPVTDLHGVDEEHGRVYFSAARVHPSSRSVGWAPLEGGRVRWVVGPAARRSSLPAGQRLTGEGPNGGPPPGGVHTARFSSDHRYFFESSSTFSRPRATTLRTADGAEVRSLEDNAELRGKLEELELGRSEFFTVEAADGTPLNAWMIRPPGFEPDRSYPLLLYVYGGPGVQTVMDAWGGTRHLWHHLLAQRGFVVVSVDNRGTGGRSRAFTKQTYLRLGQLETADQLAAVRRLGERPYVDAGRVGVWGWSYGGYMTLLTTLQSDGAVAAGASVAPVTHWKFYDTIYTERYMRTPRENPDGYRKGSPLTYADRLASELLIVHGTGDDNVHPQNTIRMVQELEKANEQFRLRLYPNERHGIGGSTSRVNLFDLLTGYFQESLGSDETQGGSVAASGEAALRQASGG